MKTLLYSVLALGLLATVSCKDDDNTPAPMPTDAVAYNGKNYSINTGIIMDRGAFENHYNYDFYLTNGLIDFENETAEDATVFIFAELWSPGTDEFSAGTYNFQGSGNTDGKRYFESFMAFIDTNNNGELDEDDTFLAAKSGTVKVTEAGTSYAIEMEVTLSNNKTLRGSYSGTFHIQEDVIGEETFRAGRRIGKRIP